jgi:hypothetical protein
MPNLTQPARLVLALTAVVFGLFGLLATPTAAVAATTADRLQLTWEGGGTELRVDGYGYRPKELVEVRLGSSTIQQTRSDETGAVQIRVPDTLITAGQSGVSIVLAGRSVSGTSRMLVSAVPPRAAARGPVDVLPWAIACAVIAVAGLVVLGRRRTSGSPESAPTGYRRRHAA